MVKRIVMKKRNHDYLKAIQEKMGSIPYYPLTSMKMKEVSWGQCPMEVSIQGKYFHQYGMVHGGGLRLTPPKFLE